MSRTSFCWAVQSNSKQNQPNAPSQRHTRGMRLQQRHTPPAMQWQLHQWRPNSSDGQQPCSSCQPTATWWRDSHVCCCDSTHRQLAVSNRQRCSCRHRASAVTDRTEHAVLSAVLLVAKPLVAPCRCKCVMRQPTLSIATRVDSKRVTRCRAGATPHTATQCTRIRVFRHLYISNHIIPAVLQTFHCQPCICARC